LLSGQIGGCGQTIAGVVAPFGVPTGIGHGMGAQTIAGVVAPFGVPAGIRHGKGEQTSVAPVTPVAARGAPGTASGHGDGGQCGVTPVGPVAPPGSSGSPMPSVAHQSRGQMRCGSVPASGQTRGGSQSVAPVAPVAPAGSAVSQRQGGMQGAARWCERRWRLPRRDFAAAFVAVADFAVATIPAPPVVVATGQSSAGPVACTAAP
jgi:hypothetical protein